MRTRSGSAAMEETGRGSTSTNALDFERTTSRKVKI